eukprot:CFRG3318T1
MGLDATVELEALPSVNLDDEVPKSGRSLSFVQGAIVGAVAGSLEISIQQPTVAWKNALQDRRPITFNPREMYRGVFINVVSMAPITGVQFSAMQVISGLVKKSHELTKTEKILSAAGAGSISALISGPAELIVIQQQKSGLSMGAECARICKQYGIARLYRGLSMAAGREALFTAGYLGLGPIVKTSLQEMSPTLKENDFMGLVAGGCVAGLFAGVLTHPLDTVKTRVQSDIAGAVYKGPTAAAKALYREEGFGAFYKGFLPRLGRLCGAVIILNKSAIILEQFVLDNNILG